MNAALRRLALLALIAVAMLVGACAAPMEEADSSTAALGNQVLDPTRSYDDRLAIMDVLERQHPMPAGWPDARQGIYVQTEWQKTSGRATRGGDGRLWGWWPNVNYTLTAWQIIVLQRDRGELRDVHVVEYDDRRFDVTEEASRAILEFYDAVDAARAAPAGPVHERLEAQAALQAKMWRMHQAALEAGIEGNESVRQSLPPGEREFAASWAGLVDLLTAANFPTDDFLVGRINDLVLPQHLVESADYDVRRGTDLAAVTRTGVVAIKLISEFERRTGRLIEKLLRRIATSAKGAHDAAHYLVEALQHAGEDPAGFLRDAALRRIDTSDHEH